MSVLLNYAMFPSDKGTSKSAYVSRIIEMLKESGVKYKLNPMGTTIETETLRDALNIIEKSYELLAVDCERVYSSINIDIQTNKPFGRMEGKVQSIEEKIGNVNK